MGSLFVDLHLPSHELDQCPHTRSATATPARPCLTARRLQRLDADHLQVLAGARVQVQGPAHTVGCWNSRRRPPSRGAPPATLEVLPSAACSLQGLNGARLQGLAVAGLRGSAPPCLAGVARPMSNRQRDCILTHSDRVRAREPSLQQIDDLGFTFE
jgi:hypothetical protein